MLNKSNRFEKSSIWCVRSVFFRQSWNRWVMISWICSYCMISTPECLYSELKSQLPTHRLFLFYFLMWLLNIITFYWENTTKISVLLKGLTVSLIFFFCRHTDKTDKRSSNKAGCACSVKQSWKITAAFCFSASWGVSYESVIKSVVIFRLFRLSDSSTWPESLNVSLIGCFAAEIISSSGCRTSRNVWAKEFRNRCQRMERIQPCNGK